jgi:quercetin dioxygenase-like cupin family protein
MKVAHFSQTPAEKVHMEGAEGVCVRWLISDRDGAPNFAMRYFEIEPGGYTPRHSHPYEHEVFILEGEGVVLEGDIERRLRPGVAVYVAPNELHQFRNTGATVLRMLCLVPHQRPCA